MNQIEHVVFLMMENRSFDTLLGWLYDDKRAPLKHIPPAQPGDQRNVYDGLYGHSLNEFYNYEEHNKFRVTPTHGARGLGMPNIAPGEKFHEVNVQLFEKENPGPEDTPTMAGYARDFINVMRSHGAPDDQIRRYADQVMQCFLPQQLPVLNGLAEHYAVCDAWFSSVPSQTNPNRAFALCGTSMGLVDNGFLEEDQRRLKVEELATYKLGDDRFHARTIFNALEDSHASWMIYGMSPLLPKKMGIALTAATPLKAILDRDDVLGPGGADYVRECSLPGLASDYTWRLFPKICEKIPDAQSHFGTIAEFHQRARAGTLPQFTYLEPDWTIAETGTGFNWTTSGKAKDLVKALMVQLGNDYHPPGNLDAGDGLLRTVYESLIANRAAWEKTLLLITFDEPVGSFDHVSPPAATPPWLKSQVQDYPDGTKKVIPMPDAKKFPPPAPTARLDPRPGIPLEHGFEFDRYGGRVPAILVSPLIEKGTVFRSTTDVPYDHTSIIATVFKWLRLPSLIEFGRRTEQAPTFDNVVTLTTPRTDERQIRFLQFSRKHGDPVHYYDRFRLRTLGGKYIAGFKEHFVIPTSFFGTDPTFSQYFPRMSNGQDTEFYFQQVPEQLRVSFGQVAGDGNAETRLISTDPGLGAYNVMGYWRDSGYCYYFNDYLSGAESDREAWYITKSDLSPLKFGDQIRIRNKAESKFLATSSDRGVWPDYLTMYGENDGVDWIIEPVP